MHVSGVQSRTLYQGISGPFPGLREGLWLFSQCGKTFVPATFLCRTCTVSVGVRRLVSVHLSSKCWPPASALAFGMDAAVGKGTKAASPLPASPCSTVFFSIILLPTLLEFPVFVIV